MPLDRRTFLKGATATALGLAAQPRRAAAAPTAEELILGARGDLRVLESKPFNAETPVTLLDGDVTPNHHHFIRNNGLVPARAPLRDLDGWTLRVDGAVDRPTEFTLQQLQKDFEARTANIVIECAGNGRAGYRPAARGNQWTLGAVGCAQWTGVLLRDVLETVDVRLNAAVHVAYEGEDRHLSGDPDKRPISRAIPIQKAIDEHTLLAWAMNGEPLPPEHGWPLRLIVPGYPGSASGKWLRRLWVRDQEHDGAKMGGLSYRMPVEPVAPGGTVDPEKTQIIELMPVKSIITHPGTGAAIKAGEPIQIRGQAWSGSGRISAVDLSWDFGHTWTSANLQGPPNPFAWQRFAKPITLPGRGYWEVWARATDETGAMQPQVVPGWNPKGYLNNAMQRIAIEVA
jgi:DMSO/TMAO reductase YedYZ molybdopterin-dependent catalytic subunit